MNWNFCLHLPICDIMTSFARSNFDNFLSSIFSINRKSFDFLFCLTFGSFMFWTQSSEYIRHFHSSSRTKTLPSIDILLFESYDSEWLISWWAIINARNRKLRRLVLVLQTKRLLWLLRNVRVELVTSTITD